MSVPVIEGKGSGEAGHGDARLDARADCPPPGLLPRAKPTGKVTGPIRNDRLPPAPELLSGKRTPQSEARETVPVPAAPGYAPGNFPRLT